MMAAPMAQTPHATASPETLPEAFGVFLRFWSPRILLAGTLVAALARLGVSGFGAGDLAVLAAIVVSWPFVEWVIHVFILHYRPVTIMGRRIDFPVPRKHRAHHRDPTDLPLVFIPIHVFLYAIPLQVLFWFSLMPSAALALTGTTVYFAMSLRYEWFHFLIHTRYRPRSRYYQRRWRTHRLHHYKNEHYWFGVSTVAADRVLGTAPDLRAVPTSATCRTLGQTATLGA
jgi:hypothetical protein